MKNTAVTPRALELKKHLGQVFLKDQKVIDRIISACQLTKSDSVLEIGPGQGALTHKLGKAAKEVIAIETDKRFVDSFTENALPDNIKIIHADFLKIDLNEFPRGLIAVGNLPYYIASPIIQKLIEGRKCFKRLFLTVQLEFGKRMIASPGTKDYSALTCFVQYYSTAKMLFQIKKGSFSPVPKVDSCFMQLEMREHPELKATDETLLFKIIHLAFQQRRKTFPNTLAQFAGKQKVEQILETLNLNNRLRPENLSVNDFVRIANALNTRN